ncbi:MAG: hypothetical protein RLY65_1899, partial [Pseudomonadota bacterium]
PIGIAASPRRLAASLADSSVLFLLATVGLIERVHETSPEAFAMLIMAGTFFCLAWSLDSPRQASWLLGFIVSAAWLCKGMWFGLGLGLAILILVKLSPHWRSIAPVMLPRASLVVVLVLLLWFWLMYRDPVSAVSADDEAAHATRLNWMAAWWTLQLGGPLKGFATRIFDLLREPWWFFWPVWPVAIWAVWSLRDRIREPSLIAPISLIAAMVLFSPVAHGSSLAWFMPIAVPLAALAALGLPSLRRGLVQFVDWYAVLVYGLIALMFWVYYLAWMIGAGEDGLSHGYFGKGRSSRKHMVWYAGCIGNQPRLDRYRWVATFQASRCALEARATCLKRLGVDLVFVSDAVSGRP